MPLVLTCFYLQTQTPFFLRIYSAYTSYSVLPYINLLFIAILTLLHIPDIQYALPDKLGHVTWQQEDALAISFKKPLIGSPHTLVHIYSTVNKYSSTPAMPDIPYMYGRDECSPISFSFLLTQAQWGSSGKKHRQELGVMHGMVQNRYIS